MRHAHFSGFALVFTARALFLCAMLVSYLTPCFVVAGPSFLMRQALRGGSVLAGRMWRSAAPVAMGVKQLPSLVGSAPSVRHMHQALPALYIRDDEEEGWQSIHGRTEVRTYNPCVDSMFRYGFGDNDIVIRFLNVMLDFHGDARITHITRLPVRLTSESPFGYDFFVDYRCQSADGKEFLVEMQNDLRSDYYMKALVEHSRMLADADKILKEKEASRNKEDPKAANNKRDFWKELKGMYTVVLSNKAFRGKKKHYTDEKAMEPEVINPYELRHMHHLNRHYGDIPYQIIFVMLANLTDDVTALRTAAERWSFVFKDNNLRSGNKKAITPEKVLKHVDTLVQDEPQLERFIERLAVSNIPVNEQEKYERDLSWYFRDLEERFKEKMEEGRKEGREEGREEGKKEGREEGKKEGRKEGRKEGEKIGLEKARLQMAKSMKKNGFSEEQIKIVLKGMQLKEMQ